MPKPYGVKIKIMMRFEKLFIKKLLYDTISVRKPRSFIHINLRQRIKIHKVRKKLRLSMCIKNMFKKIT